MMRFEIAIREEAPLDETADALKRFADWVGHTEGRDMFTFDSNGQTILWSRHGWNVGTATWK